MGLFGDIVDAVGDAAGDAVGAVVDAAGDVVEAVGDAAEAVGEAVEDAAEAVGEAVEDAVDAVADAASDAVDAIADAVDDALGAVAEAAEGVWDAAEAVWNDVTGVAEDIWEGVAGGVEDAWEALGDAADAAWDAATGAVEDAWGAVTEAAEDAWDAVSSAAEDAWEEAVALVEATIDQLGRLYEWAVEAAERAVEWLGGLIVDIGELFLQLGACIAGQVVYQLAKSYNVIANALRPLRTLSEDFKNDMAVVFGGTRFDDVVFVDEAALSANVFSDDTDAMTFAGLTIAGVTVNTMIFMRDAFDETDNASRELMAHELVHATQYRRFLTEPAFACAYGIGYAQAGFDYASNPLEAEAFSFVTANAAAI